MHHDALETLSYRLDALERQTLRWQVAAGIAYAALALLILLWDGKSLPSVVKKETTVIREPDGGGSRPWPPGRAR